MADDSPPPYSAVVKTPLAVPLVSESPEAALPFNHPDHLAAKILALISDGQTLDSRLKDVRDVASMGAKFEYQEHAVIFCQRFEALVWESRNIAGVALVAVKDFNEVVLDFLSEPDVVVQDRLKELSSTSKMLQRERDSATNQKSSFDALVKELEGFRHTIHSEPGAFISKRRKQSQSGGRAIKGTRPSRKLRTPFVVPRSEPMSGLSTVTASLGVISRTCMDYTLQFERIAEQALLPSWIVSSPSEALPPPEQDASPRASLSNPPERKRLCAPMECAESPALTGHVDTLVRDLRAFASRVDIFDTVFAELARAQDVFVMYLKDGQSVANRGYRTEINRLRRQLPCVCNALDAYSKAKLS